ncbi:MAG: hypothetical protein IPL46_12690 [Saprospiraceae bacterium]|nr:hypothetical protein [Saprospiraceae bacterium]
MKVLLLTLISLYMSAIGISQDQPSAHGSESIKEVSYVDWKNKYEDHEAEILSAHISVSTGFVNSAFQDEFEITLGETPMESDLITPYLKPLQYTVSNVEGIILDRGRFIGTEDLDFTRRQEGKYAVYIFAADRIVRAFMVSKNAEISNVF